MAAQATSATLPRGYPLVRLVSFAGLGALTARHLNADEIAPAVGAGLGVALGFVGLGVLRVLLAISCPRVMQQHGYRGIRAATGAGFLMMFPFAALAAAAELHLGWNAVQAFAMAGIMTSGAAAGSELVRLGAGPVVGAVVPTFLAFLFSAAWGLTSALAQMLPL